MVIIIQTLIMVAQRFANDNLTEVIIIQALVMINKKNALQKWRLMALRTNTNV